LEFWINFPKIDINKIATVNLKALKGNINGNTFILFQAQKNIKPREIMGISYGSGYWYSWNTSFWLLDNNGQKIVEAEYRRTGELIPVKKLGLS
jgi:hypothetical protein